MPLFFLCSSGVEEDEEDELKQLLTDWVILLEAEIDKKPKTKKEEEKDENEKKEAKGVIIRDVAMRALGKEDNG